MSVHLVTFDYWQFTKNVLIYTVEWAIAFIKLIIIMLGWKLILVLALIAIIWFTINRRICERGAKK